MTFQPGAMINTQGFGNRPENVEVPFYANAAPTTSDTGSPTFPIGKVWIDQVGNAAYTLTSLSTIGGVISATWVTTGGGAGAVATLTGDTGTATPSGGNIKIAGTANQITTAASGATVTISLPSAITTPGSLTTTTSLSATTTVTAGTGITSTTGNIVATAGAVNAGTSMTATLGNITATNGNLSLGTAGNKIVIATGSNASVGTSAVMSGTPGAVTVATTASSGTAKIFYSRATTGGTPGEVSITAQDGTGFTLTSTANETSTFNWWIINA